jgi:cell division septal protein FtsQ
VYKLTSVLRKNFQGAKSITVVKRLPNKLVITVVERTPLAIIYKTDSTGDFLIDGDGYVLGPVDSDSLALPRIKYNQGDIVVGSFVNKNIIPVSKQIIDDADAASLKISSISFSPAYTQLYVNDSVEVLIGNDKDKKQAIEVITALVKKLGLEGKKLKKIDLRYDKVIVLYD